MVDTDSDPDDTFEQSNQHTTSSTFIATHPSVTPEELLVNNTFHNNTGGVDEGASTRQPFTDLSERDANSLLTPSRKTEPSDPRISQVELERREREYREFVRNLRGTGDPRALNRFDYAPMYAQSWIRKGRYSRRRVTLPANPPANLQRLQQLSQPLPQKKTQKNPNVTINFMSTSIEQQPRREFPPLTKQSNEFYERLAAVKPEKRRVTFRPPPPLEYEKRHLPPITGAKAAHINHLANTLPVSTKMKRNLKFTDLVQPFVLPPPGITKQRNK